MNTEMSKWEPDPPANKPSRVSKEKLQAGKEHTELPCAQAQSWLTTVMSCKSDTNQVQYSVEFKKPLYPTMFVGLSKHLY